MSVMLTSQPGLRTEELVRAPKPRKSRRVKRGKPIDVSQKAVALNADPEYQKIEAELRSVLGKYIVSSSYSSGLPNTTVMTDANYRKNYSQFIDTEWGGLQHGYLLPPEIDAPFYIASSRRNGEVPLPREIESLTIATPKELKGADYKGYSCQPNITIRIGEMVLLIKRARKGDEDARNKFINFAAKFSSLNKDFCPDLMKLLN